MVCCIKSFFEIQKYSTSKSLSSSAFLMVSVKSVKACVVECLFLNPNCLEKRHLLSSKDFVSLVFMSFSNNLLMFGSNEIGL